ncbi:hypothetical protein PF005_g698 [Phytophthora fragariae]|uniref:Uncharacterized protein n=1 Tax=Phytophthora fragariae TaxID=53985 RepID=A0A6A4EPZ1_9STRA|nr:hypothetical protein PF003_g8388 [Phytophthora fragariae]KAE9237280.1 hypothetical protein PF005_g698 [Phytophthora fragariae]KAE9329908.1 hypothetical protein PF001_g640 [Phytophthora fragariae]
MLSATPPRTLLHLNICLPPAAKHARTPPPTRRATSNRLWGAAQSTTPPLASRRCCSPVRGSLRCKAGTNATPDPTRHKQPPAGRCAEHNTFLDRPTVHHASALRLLNSSAELTCLWGS